jgi:hypothetical protein
VQFRITEATPFEVGNKEILSNFGDSREIKTGI